MIKKLANIKPKKVYLGSSKGNRKTWQSSSPIEVNHSISLKDRDRLSDEEKGKYQRLVDKFNYLTQTRPNITYVVNVVSQFIYASTNIHLVVAEKFLCYLKKNRLSIEVYTDVD